MSLETTDQAKIFLFLLSQHHVFLLRVWHSPVLVWKCWVITLYSSRITEELVQNKPPENVQEVKQWSSFVITASGVYV